MVSKTGLSIAEDAQEEDFVVIEVTGEEFVPWLVCSIVDEATNAIESLGADDNWMGFAEPGDFIIKLHVWEAAGPRERKFIQRDRVFWGFAEDLRMKIDPSTFPIVERRQSICNTPALQRARAQVERELADIL